MLLLKTSIISTSLFGLLFFNNLIAQEIERDLFFIPSSQDKFSSLDIEAVRGGSPPMALPFLDDFAWPSSFEESGIDRPELVRWDSSPVRRTNTFAINPPTIGVATLDGLDAGGYPYQFNSTDAHGWADTLTSRQLLLGGMTAADGVMLSFLYQGGGLGNAPDPGTDSLIVEFKSIGSEGNIWTRVWGQDGSEMTTFNQVSIPVNEGIYLHNSFQFRFRNYGTLQGNADLWHIDYVYVAENGATGAPPEELAFQEPAYTLLRSFSSMPWTHYSSNPSFFMKDTLIVQNNNFGSGSDNQEFTGITLRLESPDILPIPYTNQFIENVSVPVGPFSTEFLANLLNELGSPSDLIYDVSLSDSTATFEVSIWEEEIGFYTDQSQVFDNDSIGFRQVFDNYYSYDDGTAEKAYAIDAVGGQIAVRYPLAIADTLDGVAIHFTPFYDNAEQETFVLKVWSDDIDMPGFPGNLIDTMYQFHNPYYFTEGYDMFAYYPLDNPIPVSGVIHVGFIQQNVARLNVGLDKNTNSNVGNLHYKLGVGNEWAESSISGSLMIHPVLRAGKELIVSTEDIGAPIEVKELASSLVPNPTTTHVHFIAQEALSWTLYSMNYAVVSSGFKDYSGRVDVDISSCEAGIYWIQITSLVSNRYTGQRLVVLPH
tara:strand:- start:3002 stop:4960 length:1959 start_codon:yes stop_codon:yes gene_type:complete